MENVLNKKRIFWMRKSVTLMFPASFMAAMILTWSCMRSLPNEQITTSTCLSALTRLWWSFISPCRDEWV